MLVALAVPGSAQQPSPRTEPAERLQLVPNSATVIVERQIQFLHPKAIGTQLHWYVDQIAGGNEAVGWVSPDGLYTAPASVPAGRTVTVQAIGSRSRSATASVAVVYETQLGSPLHTSPENPRYFANAAGPVYLTGSHTWSNVQDRSDSDPPRRLDYDAYIQFLKSKNHNFTRLWAWSLPKDHCQGIHYTEPFPWPRTGPGQASDGKPKFDVRQFNQAYFDRLHHRVQVAQENGIFVSVMLFEGVLIQCDLPDDGFPFYSQNNINGIEAAKGWGTLHRTGGFPYFTRTFCNHEWLTGANPVVLEIQKAYVAKVIDTLNDFDNLIWEVANESGSKSEPWQREIMTLHTRTRSQAPQTASGWFDL